MSDDRKLPLEGQVLAHVKNFDEYAENDGNFTIATIHDANVTTSVMVSLRGDMHRPVLDIDVPLVVIPSSTPGHNHLYIDKAMTWDEYERFLNVMLDVGLLEPGYVKASLNRRFTSVRLPWVKKTPEEMRKVEEMREALKSAPKPFPLEPTATKDRPW